MSLLAAALAWAGAAVAVRRLGRGPDADPPAPETLPFVSIIVPARNEAHNLPALLASLDKLDYPAYEVIVIDDASSDGTSAVAASFGARVIAGRPLPDGWNGKNWACHQAAGEAKGEALLFTDADTVHRPDGLRRALGFMAARNADLVSALPRHRCPTAWEKLSGPFHALLLVATAHRAPKRRRLYAVGQFLLFRRSFYDRIHGHRSIAPLYPDDLSLANLTLARGGRFAFHAGRPFFEVRMYGSVPEFFAGWRRNFAAGLRQSRWTSALEVTLVIIALCAGGRPWAGPLYWAPAAIVLGVVALRQRHWGEFSIAGVLVFPAALAAYGAVTAAAVFDFLRGGKLLWKDRTLTGWAGEGTLP